MGSYCAAAGSPATDLRNWMVEHEAPAAPTAAALGHFIQRMPLPDVLSELLKTSIYTVPAEGLFACSTTMLPEAVACPRQDVVQKLLAAARRQPLAFVACIGGRRRQGKSFSNPWAQLETIRLLEGQPGQPAARSRFVFYLSCLSKETSEPTVYDQTLLLATLVSAIAANCELQQNNRCLDSQACYHKSAVHSSHSPQSCSPFISLTTMLQFIHLTHLGRS